MSVICPDCEVELEEGANKCPKCGLGIFEIASRPRKRKPAKIKTITLWILKWERLEDGRSKPVPVPGTFKVNPQTYRFLSCPSPEDEKHFRWYANSNIRRNEIGSWRNNLQKDPKTILDRVYRDRHTALDNAIDYLEKSKRELADFLEFYPEYREKDEEK